MSQDRTISFEALQAAGRKARLERFLAGEPRPGKRRLRPRTPEKLALLAAAFQATLRKYPQRAEIIDGRRVLFIPFYCPDPDAWHAQNAASDPTSDPSA